VTGREDDVLAGSRVVNVWYGFAAGKRSEAPAEWVDRTV